MLKKSPLETTVMIPFLRNYSDIKKVLEEQYISDSELQDPDYTRIIKASTGDCNVTIIGLTEANTNPIIKQLDAFFHPIMIGNKNDELVTFIDLRPLTIKDGHKYRLRVGSEVELFQNYAILASYWNYDNNEINRLKAIGSFPAQAFVETIFEILNRLYMLDPMEQMKVKVIASYYYNEVLFHSGNNENVNMARIAMSINKSTKVPTATVLEILNELDKDHPIENIDSLCKAFVGVNHLKLGRLTAPVLLTSIGTIWFGSAAKQRIAIAIEYPPMWTVLCYAALNEASFKRTPLGKTAERISKISDARAFVLGFNSLLGLKTTER
jgi:hypothetical protein